MLGFNCCFDVLFTYPNNSDCSETSFAQIECTVAACERELLVQDQSAIALSKLLILANSSTVQEYSSQTYHVHKVLLHDKPHDVRHEPVVFRIHTTGIDNLATRPVDTTNHDARLS